MFDKATNSTNVTKKFSTFTISDRLYGIEVMSVQEVTMPLPYIKVPKAPVFVKGLINLRGQISTAVDIKGLFGLKADNTDDKMAVVCKHEDCLISLLIDDIGDVIELNNSSFENPPDTLDNETRKYFEGIYKLNDSLLTIIDVKEIFQLINHKDELDPIAI